MNVKTIVVCVESLILLTSLITTDLVLTRGAMTPEDKERKPAQVGFFVLEALKAVGICTMAISRFVR
jgi:hypothetical protein